MLSPENLSAVSIVFFALGMMTVILDIMVSREIGKKIHELGAALEANRELLTRIEAENDEGDHWKTGA